MKENFAIDAINHIDNDLVEEYAKEKEHLKRKRENKKRTPWIKWASVAACFLLVVVTSVLVIPMMFGNDPQLPITPEKPDMNSVYWMTQGSSGSSPDSTDEYTELNGMKVSEALYKAINESDSSYFGILVTTTAEKELVATEEISLFTDMGIYAEIVEDKLFIFPTKDKFLNLKLPAEKKNSFLFSLSSKAAYTGENEIVVPPSNVGDWEDVDPSKFGIYIGTISEPSFESVEAFKAAYETLYELIGWDSNAIIALECFITDEEFSGVYFEYMEYENISFSTIPNRATVSVKLSEFDVEDILNISNDKRISKVYISQDNIANDDGASDGGVDNDAVDEPSITGVVTKVYENSFLMLGEATGNYAAEEYSVSLNVENGDSYGDIIVGDEVIVYYNGDIAESDPLQINTVYAITLNNAAEIPAFSYEEVMNEYMENDPGVFYDGFKNTSTLKVASTDEAIARAKNECTIEYDTTKVCYDGGTAMWKVNFSMAGTPGGDQTVYLDMKGITRLVVYGE